MHKFTFIFLIFLILSCTDKTFEKEWTQEQAPKTFIGVFETTKGTFEITVERKWSPKAADRLYQLIKHDYYNNGIFYRVVPKFVAQFGNTDTIIMNQWRAVKIPDEIVKLTNNKGTVSFARLGKDSRDLELFINLNNNTTLDTLQFEGVVGFPAIGMVTSGMETVEKLYSGYGEKTMTDPNLYVNRSLFYKTHPKLDLIKRAYLKVSE